MSDSCIAKDMVANENFTKEPVTKEPVTKEPVTKEPVTKEPVTKEPVTKEPVTKEPVTKEPVTKEPVTKEPVTNETVANEFVANGTVAEQTIIDETATDETATDETVADETVADETATNETATNEKDECYFLDLIPAELRNEIYRLVLLSPDRIQYNRPGNKAPSLLRVNKQIRDEAQGIYFVENKFTLNISGLGSRPVHLLTLQAGRYISQVDIEWVYHVSKPSWMSILRWAKHVHAKPEFPMARAGGHQSKAVQALEKVIKRASEVRDLEWAQAVKELMKVKKELKMRWLPNEWKTGEKRDGAGWEV